MALRRHLQRRLRRRCRVSRTLVLTYDDGPGPEITPDVLDLLRERGAIATFFPTGARAQEHPEIVDRIAAEGHEIGCHSHLHLSAWRTWPWRNISDINSGYRALARWLPRHATFRPPYGKMTVATWLALWRRRAAIGWWTTESGDVSARLPSPDDVVERIRRTGGGVVLLHDCERSDERKRFVLECTERLLDTAAREHWTIRSLGELTSEPLSHAA